LELNEKDLAAKLELVNDAFLAQGVELKHAESSNTDLSNKCELLQVALGQSQKENQKSLDNLNATRSNNQEEKESLVATFEKELETANEQKCDAQVKNDELKQVISALDQQNQQVNQTLVKTQIENEALTSRLAEVSSRVETLETRNCTLTEANISQQTEIQYLEQDFHLMKTHLQKKLQSSLAETAIMSREKQRADQELTLVKNENQTLHLQLVHLTKTIARLERVAKVSDTEDQSSLVLTRLKETVDPIDQVIYLLYLIC
jgi:hypothetical protein